MKSTIVRNPSHKSGMFSSTGRFTSKINIVLSEKQEDILKKPKKKKFRPSILPSFNVKFNM